MNITFIRQDSGSGKETLSVCEAGTLFDKMKTETKLLLSAKTQKGINIPPEAL